MPCASEYTARAFLHAHPVSDAYIIITTTVLSVYVEFSPSKNSVLSLDRHTLQRAEIVAI